MSRSADNTTQLVLADDVVALAGLNGRLTGVRKLIVRQRAIVTPAVRDYLREKKIELARQTADQARQPGDTAGAGKQTAANGKTRLLLGVANTAYKPSELIHTLSREPIAIQQSSAGGLFELVDALVSEVKIGNTLAMLVTDDVFGAVSLANRTAGVRAVNAGNCIEVDAAVASIGANFVIIHPRGKSLFDMKRIVTHFCRGGVRTCPEPWKSHL